MSAECEWMMERETFFSGQPVIDRKRGSSFPLGATVSQDGVNFSVFSRQATGVDLLLFNHPEDADPATVLTLDPMADGARMERAYAYLALKWNDRAASDLQYVLSHSKDSVFKQRARELLDALPDKPNK